MAVRIAVVWRTVLAGVLGVLGLILLSPPAQAADDQIDAFDITYVVQPSGVLQVQERITWRFGSNSGRHGIQRDLLTREPDPDTGQDIVYDVSAVSVTSPDPVSTATSTKTTTTQSGRETHLNLRIGDPDRTVSAATATYVLSYRVSGALRSFADYDELFWDGPGFGNPGIKALTMKATVPGGALDTQCFAGPPRSTTPCQSHTVSKAGVATFGQANLPTGESVSLGVKIGSGLVSDNKPHLEPDASQWTAQQKLGAAVLAALGLLVTVGSPLLGWLYWRRNGRDQRYAGLAPGTVPLAGQPAHIVLNDPDLPIPVAFSPPKIPVAEAGLLIDGQVDTRETAATIIDLAVRGALAVNDTDEGVVVRLIDPGRAAAPHEMVLLNSVFGGDPPGTEVALSGPGTLTAAHRALTTSVRSQVTARGWFRRVPSATTTGTSWFGAVVVAGGIGWSVFGAGVLLLLVPLLPIVITVAVVRAKMRRGQRTADGRAMTDQVEGFRTYLATAEADQLRFEEGEDIFSRYLPWAVMLELADRWAKICQDLVAAGRLADTTPAWYYGNSYNFMSFNIGSMTNSMTTAATPVSSSAGSSGGGFGSSGSSFSGGGFSGGGGGGGGSSSW